MCVFPEEYLNSFLTEPQQSHDSTVQAPVSTADPGNSTASGMVNVLNGSEGITKEAYSAQCMSDSREFASSKSYPEAPRNISGTESFSEIEDTLRKIACIPAVKVQNAQASKSRTVGSNGNPVQTSTDSTSLKVVSPMSIDFSHDSQGPVNTGCAVQNSQIPKNSGFGVENTQAPLSTGYGAQNAQAPLTTVYSVQNAQAPVNTGYTVQNAQAPSSKGYSVQNATAPVTSGDGAQKAQAPVNTGYTVQKAQTPLSIGYSVQNATAPVNSGDGVQKARAHADTGYGCQDARAPVDTGYSVQSAPVSVSNGYRAQNAPAPPSTRYAVQNAQPLANTVNGVQNAQTPVNAGYAYQSAPVTMNAGYGYQNAQVPMSTGYDCRSIPAHQVASAPVSSYQMSSGYSHPTAATSYTHNVLKVIAETRNNPSMDHHPPSGTNGAVGECPTPERNSKRPKLERPSSPENSSELKCPICQERTTGKHYGIECCDGCKSFFRRSIRSKANFRCDRIGQCDTKKKSDSRCRACRLAKCIQAGMNRKRRFPFQVMMRDMTSPSRRRDFQRD